MKESIDANGNYIAQTIGGKHIDHGTAVMKDAKACFTSAMTKDGEVCWTTGPVKIGQSMVTKQQQGRETDGDAGQIYVHCRCRSKDSRAKSCFPA